MSIPNKIAEDIIQIGRRLYDRGLICGNQGNISAKVSDDRIAITPSGICKGRMEISDLVEIDLSGGQLSGDRLPSSETAMHIYIYRHRADVSACVHAHPPYATSFAVVGTALSKPVLPETILEVGEIRLVEYAPPGTDSLARSLDGHIENSDAFLLSNHGVVTIAPNLESGFNRMEMVEHYARVLYLSSNLGEINALDDNEVARFQKLRLEGRSKAQQAKDN